MNFRKIDSQDISKYYDSGHTLYECALFFRCSPSCIYGRLLKVGLSRRRAIARKGHQKHHKVLKTCTICGQEKMSSEFRESKKVICKSCTGLKQPFKKYKILSHGYVYVLSPGHPRTDENGRVREHIIVWEEAYGRPLPGGWLIHHLNGIKNDNRPENLFATTQSKHHSLKRPYKKRILDLEKENDALRQSRLL